MPDLPSAAAQALHRAESLLIAAGAGMGVDSGLPDFRGNEGFWRAYPPLAKLGLSFAEIANPEWFERDPELAWGFYGHRLQLYRQTTPHAGFAALLRCARGKPGGAFVFTSNVDGHFRRAGFAAEQVVECHGSIHHLQCTKDCRSEIWPAPDALEFTVDDTTCRAVGELPRCPHCGALARPNILMFYDGAWQPRRTEGQEAAFARWQKARDPNRIVIVELGAGTAIPTVRRQSEALQKAGAVLIRINIRESAGPAGTISIPLGALDALSRLLP
jgi:NAD-dependent SIR2 family protein deacetylase